MYVGLPYGTLVLSDLDDENSAWIFEPDIFQVRINNFTISINILRGNNLVNWNLNKFFSFGHLLSNWEASACLFK